MHTAFGTTLNGDIVAHPNTDAHYNAYPWTEIKSSLIEPTFYHPTRLVFDADLPVHLRRCSVHITISDTDLVVCDACTALVMVEFSRLENVAAEFIRQSRYFVTASASPLIVASGLKGFHIYFPVIYISQTMAVACDTTIRAMFAAAGIDYIDPQVSFNHHITGVLSPHRTATRIRALPIKTAHDYEQRITDPVSALRRGMEILEAFIDQSDYGIHP